MATFGDLLAAACNRLPSGFSEGRYTASIIVVAFFTVLWFLWSASCSFRTKGRLPLPPGNLGFPLIGETIQFGLASRTDVGYREWIKKRTTKYGPVFKSHLLGSPIVIMDPPVGNKFLFQNEGKLVENHWPGPTRRLLGPDSLTMKLGEAYKIARRHLGGFFDHAAVIRYLEGVERNAVKHFADNWEGKLKDELLALNMTKRYTFSTMCNLLMSLDEGPTMDMLQVEFAKWAKGIFGLPIKLPGFVFHDAWKARGFIWQLFGEIITHRRQELAEGKVSERCKVDVLNSLLTIADEEGEYASDSAIKDNLLLLLFAGYDTSSVALAMTIFFIGKHPVVYEQLVEEHKSICERKREKADSDALTQEDVSAMKYTWRVIQETLRLQPPVAGTFRKATTEFEYNGYLIPKDWMLMWTNQHSHYDPRFFKDPLTFDPSRWEETPTPFTFIPFGGGPRMCPGYEFAKMEMLVFIHHLIRRYHWTLVDPNERIIREPMPRTEKRTLIRVSKVKSF